MASRVRIGKSAFFIVMLSLACLLCAGPSFALYYGGGSYDGYSSADSPGLSVSNFSAAAFSESRLDYSWIRNSTNESGFAVLDGSNNVKVLAAAGAAATSETGLSANTLYTRKVHAFDAAGASTSDSTAKYTLIETPSSATFEVTTSTGITIRSGHALSNLSSGSSGVLFRNVTAGADSGWIQSNGWTSSSLSPDTEYVFQITARNSDGTSTPTLETSWTTAPAPPVNLTAQVAADFAVLSWDPPPGASAYSVSMGTDPAGTNMGTTATTEAVLKKTGLSGGTAYHWFVRSASGSGTGDASAVASFVRTASKLGFIAQPSTAESLAQITPAVRVAVQDEFGNTIIDDNSTSVTVSLLNAPPLAVLYGALTKTASSGVAGFDDLSVDRRSDGYRLEAAAPGLSSATSESFDITDDKATLVGSVAPSDASVGVSREAVVRAAFTAAMYKPSVQSAFSLKAVRDESGRPIDEPVAGALSWPDQKTAVFTPSALLNANHTYRIGIAKEAESLSGEPMQDDFSASFSTVGDNIADNTVIADDGKTALFLPAGSVGKNYYVKISTDPVSRPIAVVPAKITTANSKVAAEGNPFKFPVNASAREFVLYDNSGNRITDELNHNATVTIPYHDTDAGGPPESLLVCRLDETNGLWVLYTNSSVDTVSKTVSAPTAHLSAFGLMSVPSTTVRHVYAFPNPFKPSAGHADVTFSNLPPVCTIRIFTLTGTPVRTIPVSSDTGQTVWDVKNDAGGDLVSGMYFYVVYTPEESKTGKIVVIR
jgi:hypothetical protein